MKNLKITDVIKWTIVSIIVGATIYLAITQPENLLK